MTILQESLLLFVSRLLATFLEKAMDDHSTGITVVVCEPSISNFPSWEKKLPVGC